VTGIGVETVEAWGAKQAKITVNYRFSPQNEHARLVLKQSYNAGHFVRIPLEPKTVGDHIRRKRLSLKLVQTQVAERVGVGKSSLYNWESNAKQPEVRYMPAIIKFLGYNPLPPANTWAERLIRRRISLGLTQEESARQIRVDPGTLAHWERGEREPTGSLLKHAQQFLNVGDNLEVTRRAG